MDFKKFEKLKKLRRGYKITQLDMALKLDMCLSNYAKKENGLIPFSFDETEDIYKILNEKASEAGDRALTLDEIFLR